MSLAEDEHHNLHDFDFDGLVNFLSGFGFSAFHAKKIWQYLYRERITAVSEMKSLRADLLLLLQNKTKLTQLATEAAVESNDGFTYKYLLQLEDKATIETVQMAFKGRSTACISTQVGCAMGCVFCATGQMGFQRHLTAGEIVAQVLFVQRALAQLGDNVTEHCPHGHG